MAFAAFLVEQRIFKEVVSKSCFISIVSYMTISIFLWSVNIEYLDSLTLGSESDRATVQKS